MLAASPNKTKVDSVETSTEKSAAKNKKSGSIEGVMLPHCCGMRDKSLHTHSLYRIFSHTASTFLLAVNEKVIFYFK